MGPGARPERAGSIGWVAPWPQRSKLDSAGEGGGSLPRPLHEEISAYDSKRADLDPGPWKHWAFTTRHFQRTKVLPRIYIHLIALKKESQFDGFVKRLPA